MNALVLLCSCVLFQSYSTQRPMISCPLGTSFPPPPPQQYRFFLLRFNKIQRWFLSQLINTCTNPTAYFSLLLRLISASCRVLLNASVRTKSTVLYTIPRPELDAPALGPLFPPPEPLPIALCSLMECFMLDKDNCDAPAPAAAVAGRPT